MAEVFCQHGLACSAALFAACPFALPTLALLLIAVDLWNIVERCRGQQWRICNRLCDCSGILIDPKAEALERADSCVAFGR